MTDRSSSSTPVSPIVIVGIALAMVAGLGLIGFGIFGSPGAGHTEPTATLPPARTPLIIPTTTPIPPIPTPTTTTIPPTATPEPEEPTSTEPNPPSPTNPPAPQSTAHPPTDTPEPPPPTSDFLPTFSVANPTVSAGERIEFTFSLTNPSSTESTQLGFVGITVMRDGATAIWHQSWVGWVLEPGKTDPWADSLTIGEPGVYELWLSVCAETVENCQANLGWENVAGPITVEVH